MTSTEPNRQEATAEEQKENAYNYEVHNVNFEDINLTQNISDYYLNNIDDIEITNTLSRHGELNYDSIHLLSFDSGKGGYAVVVMYRCDADNILIEIDKEMYEKLKNKEYVEDIEDILDIKQYF